MATILMIFLRINGPNIVQLRPIGDQTFVVIRLCRTQVEWRWSQKDWLNWHLFTATRSFIKPKSICVTFQVCVHCLFTINMQLRYIGKKHSFPYQSSCIKLCSNRSSSSAQQVQLKECYIQGGPKSNPVGSVVQWCLAGRVSLTYAWSMVEM